MIRVTDHALLRFLDCAGAIDVEGTRAALEQALDRAGKAVEVLGSPDVLVIVSDFCIVVREGVATTVLPRRSPAGRRAMLQRPSKRAEP